MWVWGRQGLPLLPQIDPEAQGPAKIPPPLSWLWGEGGGWREADVGSEEEESLESWREDIERIVERPTVVL